MTTPRIYGFVVACLCMALAFLCSVATIAPREVRAHDFGGTTISEDEDDDKPVPSFGLVEPELGVVLACAKRMPLEADGLTLAGDILRKRGDWPQAEAAFRTALKAAPGRAELHLRLGQALQEQQKFEAADVEFSKFVELTRGSKP